MNNSPVPSAPSGASTPVPGALDLAARLTSILTPLLLLINARGPLLGAYFLPLHARIARAYRRLTLLLARLAAGHRARPHTPRPGTKGGPPAIRFPGHYAWLVGTLGHHAAGYASQLQFLLHDPATQATLAAAPPEALRAAGRTLRPLCRLLGVDLPATLRLPPKPPRTKPARAAPRPAPRPSLPPLLPLYPQARPRDLPFMRFRPKIQST